MRRQRAPAVRLGGRFAVAVYPFTEGQSSEWDEWSPELLDGVTGLIAQVRLLREFAGPLQRWLGQYDVLVATARQQPRPYVLTHGEPHPGNVMLTRAGWRLIDWDTALIAPPERDLWSLVQRDTAALSAYNAATGIETSPRLIELYRLRWDIADVAYDVAHFFRAHGESPNDVESWELLNSLIRQADS